MDLAILVVLIVVVIVLFRDIKWIAYLIGILEMLFRLLHYIGDNLGVAELNSLIDAYLPTSIFNILAHYTTGVVYIVLAWVVVGFLCMFLYHNICYFINKR